MSDAIYLTRAGQQKMVEDLERLKNVERRRISRAIEEARLQGDISENAEYDAAKEAQAHCEARIAELGSKIPNIQVIEDQDIPADKIYIGAFASIKDLDTEEEITYQMVSPEEASFEENRLSIFSPVGSGLMGHAEGEDVEISVPAGTLRYKVLKIARP